MLSGSTFVASFCHLYTMYRRSPDEYFKLFRRSREYLLTKDRGGAVYDQIGPLYAGRRLRSGKHPDGYSTVVYKKGGWVLHMIRMMLYDSQNAEQPDHRFMEMMQDFTRTYHNRAASTEDFKAIVEKHMTPNMDLDGNGTIDWFFDSWVYGTGIPEYRLSYTVEPAAEDGMFVVEGTVEQSRVPDGFRMIVPLYLHLGDRTARFGWLKVRGRETAFRVTLGFKPDKITLCEREDVLAVVK